MFLKKVFLLLFIIISACGQSVEYVYNIPSKLDDGIPVAEVSDQDINIEILFNGIKRVKSGRYKEIHSLLIFKDGNLVLEEYFPGHSFQYDATKFDGDFVEWDETMPHGIFSDSKSITSLCIGIAIQKGFIESIDQSIFDYLPNHQEYAIDGKEKITIKNLVTMTSGLDWDEWSASLKSRNNDIIETWFSDDPIAYPLSKPLVAAPGSRFTYSGGNINILAEIILNATKSPIDSFAMENLYRPMGIHEVSWDRYRSGEVDAAGSIKMRPRDMLKIGMMMLNDGSWNGKQILEEDWVKKSKTVFSNNTNINLPNVDCGMVDYGYTWWIRPYTFNSVAYASFFAGGWGGQYIKVFPDINTVIVFTGGIHDSKTTTFRVLDRYLIPALEN